MRIYLSAPFGRISMWWKLDTVVDGCDVSRPTSFTVRSDSTRTHLVCASSSNTITFHIYIKSQRNLIRNIGQLDVAAAGVIRPAGGVEHKHGKKHGDTSFAHPATAKRLGLRYYWGQESTQRPRGTIISEGIGEWGRRCGWFRDR